MSPACTRTTRTVRTVVRSQVTATIGPRRTCSHVPTPSMLSTRTIYLAICVHPSFVASKLISASFLRLLVRSSGMLQLASLFFLQGRAAL